MASNVTDSVFFKDQFGTDAMRRVFSDEYLLQKWLDTEAALAQAEGELGIIPGRAADEIVKKARAELMDVVEMKRQIDLTYHPIVPLIRVFQKICSGDAGEYIHWGATTQDIMDTAVVLQLKEAIKLLVADLLRLGAGLVARAEEHKSTIMAGRTHGQHALPITFGFKLAVWLDEVIRHLERMDQLYPRVIVGQLAGAAGTLASLTDDGFNVQRRMMEILGLGVSDIAWHTARDGFAEFASVVAMIAATCEKIANEVATLQKTEIGEVEEPFVRGKVGSSTMPHKRNPMMCEAIIAAAKLARPNAATALECMVHEHERDMGPWQAEWGYLPQVCIYGSGALHQTCYVVENLTVRPDVMQANLDKLNGLMLSEAVMLRLGRYIGRQRAHDVVYEASMDAFEQDVPLLDTLSKCSDIQQHVSREQLEALLDPMSYTGLCQTFVDQVVNKARRLSVTNMPNGEGLRTFEGEAV